MLTNLISTDDQERIKRFTKVFLERCTDISPRVPRIMRAGPTNSEGWTPWKAIDSPVDDDQVLEVEESLGFRFPPLFRAYLLHQCLLMTDFFVVLPEIPFDDPLGKLNEYLALREVDPFFKSQGLIPFGYDPDGIGPVCFDATNQGTEGDCPIVRVDRSLMKNSQYRSEQIAESFANLLDDIEAELLSYD